jgi:hypothetical protein
MKHDRHTPYATLADARAAWQNWQHQGCRETLYLYRSGDPDYRPGYLISRTPDATVLGNRHVELIETLKGGSQ